MYYPLEYDYEFPQDTYLEKEMQNVRDRGFQKLLTIVSHPNFVEDIALSISYGFFEGHKSSERIVEKLDLSKLELIAFQEEFKEFKELFLKEQELDFYIGEI